MEGGRSSFIVDEVGFVSAEGGGVLFGGSGISKETDLAGFWVDFGGSGFSSAGVSCGDASSIFALRRNRSSRPGSRDEISSSRSSLISVFDMDAS